MKMKQMECELSSLKAKWRSDMEIRENTVSTLRNIIKNVREDIRLGKEPRGPSPIEYETSFPALPTNIRV